MFSKCMSAQETKWLKLSEKSFIVSNTPHKTLIIGKICKADLPKNESSLICVPIIDI